MSRWSTTLILVAIAATLACGCGGGTAANHTTGARRTPEARTRPFEASTASVARIGPLVLPARTFAASVDTDHDDLDLVSAVTGKVIRRILPSTRGRLGLDGVSVLRRGVLLVTYSTGPSCSGDIAGCGPIQGSCGAEVDSVRVSTGAVTSLWRVGRDSRLSDAVASPDGQQFAALASPCVPSYFNDHVVVRRIADGQTWQLGNGLPRCHALSPPAWTNHGADLLVAYAPATSPKPYTGADGTCAATGDSELLRVNAHRDQSALSGKAWKPARGCTFESVAGSSTSAFATQGCGPQEHLQGPAWLDRLASSGRPARQWRIGTCTDGNDVAINAHDQVLVAAYLFCNPPLHHHKLKPEKTVLDRLTGTGLVRIRTVSGWGNPVWDDLAW
jgi:hypothetical protein